MANSLLADKLKIRLDEDQLTNCMRCGFCLPACPTFRETGIEAESPRGRIALMKAVADGVMEADEAFEEQMNHCLGCRACEPACPADVKYGRLLEQARDAIEDHTSRHRPWVKGVRRLVFKELFPKMNRMRFAGKALHAYQASGLQRLARASGAMKLLPKQLADFERVLPEATGRGVAERIGERIPAKGEKVGTVGLFRGCLMDTMFTQTNVRTAELLAEAGFDVVIPPAQGCCGALHAHSGEAEGARELARRNVRAFREAGVDYIATNAGGCGAILVEYDHLLHEDSAYREDAEWFAPRVKDVAELLLKLGRTPQFGPAAAEAGPAGGARAVADRTTVPTGGSSGGVRITYQDSCHLRNVMRSSEAPRELMKRVAGADYIEMFESDRCCGSAGIYNLTQPEMANAILEHKMEHANATKAHYLLTSNPGCLLQMKLGIERHGDGGMRAMHLVDFLHERMKHSN